MAMQEFRQAFPTLAREILIIVGTWTVFTVFIAAAIDGIFYVIGMTRADLLLIIWASVLAGSIFAIPYEDYWEMKRFQLLFSLTACLVVMSFVLLAASELVLNFLNYHINSSIMIAGIFVSGGILALLTRDHWSVGMLRSIKGLTAYSILGEIFLLYLGDYIAGMGNIDPVIRMLFLAVVIVIIVVVGIAIIRLYMSDNSP